MSMHPGKPTDDEHDAAAEEFYDGEDAYCYRCDGKGVILVCIDDLCHGAGECMHGDGEIVCPDCKGLSAW